MGCHLQAFLPAWAAITDDRFILSVIRRGFTIHLTQPLPGGTLRSLPKAGTAHFRASIATEIRALLDKRAIRRVHDHPLLCLSPVFIVPKRSGKVRMILNLKAINQFIQPMSFRMETLTTILPLLGPGDWAVSIDLADAYHHVPIAASSQMLSIQGPTLRPKACPTPVHQAGGGVSQTAGDQAVLLSGRLVNRSRQPRARESAPSLYPAVSAGFGLPRELGKILPGSLPIPNLPRSRHRSPRAVS